MGGFFCVTEAPVAEGAQLPVSLMLTPSESFDCKAEVVRSDVNEDDPSGREVVLGLRFLDLAQDDEARLASILVELSDDLDENNVPLQWRLVQSAEYPLS